MCYSFSDSDGEDPNVSANREKKERESLIKEEFDKRRGGKISKRDEIEKKRERLKDEEDAIRTAKVIIISINRGMRNTVKSAPWPNRLYSKSKDFSVYIFLGFRLNQQNLRQRKSLGLT